MYFCNCILPLCNVFEGYLISSLALASNMINKASFLLLSALLICCGAKDRGMQPYQLQMNTDNTNISHSIDYFNLYLTFCFGGKQGLEQEAEVHCLRKYFFLGSTDFSV